MIWRILQLLPLVYVAVPLVDWWRHPYLTYMQLFMRWWWWYAIGAVIALVGAWWLYKTEEGD